MGNTHRYLQNQYGVVGPIVGPIATPTVGPIATPTVGPIVMYQNLDFVNPVDGHVYPTYLQNQYGFLGLPLQELSFKDFAKKAWGKAKGSFHGEIGGVSLDVSKKI